MYRRSFLKMTGVGLGALAAGLFCRAAPSSARPNILWLTVEDSNVWWIGCYGHPEATTPNIDKLAREGFRYVHAYANAPVCAPSRSTWITGLLALSMGTYPMRSRYGIPHDRIRYYPDYLREAGYYCANHAKTDYNIGGREDKACWDGRDKYGWRKRAPGQPFFCVINNTDSHESQAFGSVEGTAHDPAKVMLRKYHPDVQDIRKNYAHYADAVEKMDRGVGECLAELERDGLAEDTIVVFCSDHGGVMPRSKRFLFDTGLRSPLVVRIPAKFRHLWPAEKPGLPVERLVSFVDMPKTWLALAGAKIPAAMQGRVFLGAATEPEAKYHFAFRGRMDERFDEVRAIRDKRFLYIKNYMPYVAWGQHLDYLWKMVATRAWEKEYREGRTDAVTGLFFRAKPFVEELYDCEKDPDNVVNLSSNPECNGRLEEMRVELRRQQLAVFDPGLLPESERVRLAAAHGTTIYDLVRNPKLYDLPACLDAADVALERKVENVGRLADLLGNSDLAIRYWGVVGLLLIGAPGEAAKPALHRALGDESHEVRAMAAWCLISLGEKEAGRSCLIALLNGKSYATLKILNIIDWMGDDVAPYRVAIEAADGQADKAYITRMKEYLLTGERGGPVQGRRPLVDKADL